MPYHLFTRLVLKSNTILINSPPHVGYNTSSRSGFTKERLCYVSYLTEGWLWTNAIFRRSHGRLTIFSRPLRVWGKIRTWTNGNKIPTNPNLDYASLFQITRSKRNFKGKTVDKFTFHSWCGRPPPIITIKVSKKWKMYVRV